MCGEIEHTQRFETRITSLHCMLSQTNTNDGQTPPITTRLCFGCVDEGAP